MARVLLGNTSTTLYATAFQFQRKIVKTTEGKLVAFATLEKGGGGYSLKYKTSSDNGDTWDGSWTLVDDYWYPNGDFDVIIDGSNNIYIAWRYVNGGLYFIKLTYSGGSWTLGTIRQIDTSGYSDKLYLTILKRASGELFVTYSYGSGGVYRIYSAFSNNDGITWDNNNYTALTDNLTTLWSCIKGTTVWAIGTTTNNKLQYFIWDDGTDTWSSATNIAASGISYSGGYHNELGCVKISDDEIYAAATTSSGIKIFKYNGSWDSGTLLTDNANDRCPYLTNIYNKPTLCWSDYDGANYDISYRKYNGSSWEAQVDLTSDADIDNYPAGIDNDSEYLYVIYTVGSGSPYSIYFDKVLINTTKIKTILSDAKIKVEDVQKTILSDAKVVDRYQEELVSDAKIKAEDIQKTILSDTKIKAEDVQKTILSDALITSIVQKTILSDAKIKVFDEQKNILSDALISIHHHESILSDAKILVLGEQKTILSNAKIVILALYNINQKFNSVKEVLSNITSKVNTVIRVLSDVNNIINTVKSVISDIRNDIRTHKLILNNVTNDIRFLYSWQKSASGILQSLGKEYIKVYIGGAEQTDIDVDSISISKELNIAHTATFDLGRAYDATKPAIKATVQIKYNNWVLYSGYITNIAPSEDPEKIRINCQDEYWEQDKSNIYFNVGHKPLDEKELYYDTIQQALTTELGWNPGVGNFVPDVINCFGDSKSDALSKLIKEMGNYGWFYDVDGSKKLWIAGDGSIINLERQTLGENINLYDVIDHSFEESIDNIVNKFRVQMGDIVYRRFEGSTGTSKTETFLQYDFTHSVANPDWDSNLEKLSYEEGNTTGYGYDYHPPEENPLYQDVFRKYDIYYVLDEETESWTDEFEPYLVIQSSDFSTGLMNMSGTELSYYTDSKGVKRITYGVLYNGFTIDYKNNKVYLSDPIFSYYLNDKGECTHIRAPKITIHIGKKKEYTNTEESTENPESDISNPLMFFTDKMGDYPETILRQLNLSQFSIQRGNVHSYHDETGALITEIIPYWDDTNFAKDYANWELSKTCDKKIAGNITITLDTMCFYNIDLTKRIYIVGITEDPMNIISISYNMSNFTVNLTLENSRYYNRTVSLPRHW